MYCLEMGGVGDTSGKRCHSVLHIGFIRSPILEQGLLKQ